MALSIPPLPAGQPIVDPATGNPTIAFSVYWQQVIGAITTAFVDLSDAVAAIAAAQAAADAANAAAAAADASAATANAAAATAQTSADTANDAAVAASEATALQDSWVSGLTLGATDAGANATINISAHTRNYSDGSSVAVNIGSVTGLAYSTLYYLYYDDAARTGGAVTYSATTSPTTAAQTGNRHTVGSVTTPAAAAPDTDGKFVRPPGVGAIDTL